MDLLIAVLSGFAVAALAPWLYRVIGERMAYVVALLPLAITLYFARRAGSPEADQSVVAQFEWVPRLGLSLSLHLDGLSLLFVLLIAGMGTLVAVYARGYLAGNPQFGQFYLYIFSFMAAKLGLVLAGNVLTLYVFWELTTLTSFLLIGFEHEREAARRAALQALLTTAIGGLAMLAGLILLGIAGETFELSQLLSRGDAIRAHEHYPAILALILIGAFTKSAQFPFHFWLPSAMEAPTPVSAYLHSATMVKAGVYLLARLLPVLGGTTEWTVSVTTVGAVTMLAGAWLACFQHQLKAVLAYLTVNVLGTLVMLLGLGTKPAVKAALTYLLAHALYKGALFLVAGAISHEAHTLDVRKLGGLWRRMPVTFAAALLAALSMAGVIPLFGFVAKELYFEAVWKSPSAAWILTAASVAASTFVVAGAGIVGMRPFFRSAGENAKAVHEASLSLWIGPLLLAGAGLALGFLPHSLGAPLISPAVGAVLREPAAVELALWHGVTVPFLLSIAVLTAGVVVYLFRARLIEKSAGLATIAGRYGPAAWYELSLRGLQSAANRQTRLLQGGHLRVYVATILATCVALVGLMLSHLTEWPMRQQWIGVRFSEGVAAAVILAASWAAVRSTDRYRSIVSVGVIGFSMSWIYVLFGAPDLAMTQIVVEALTVLLFVLAFHRLPKFTNVSSRKARIRDALLALSAGGMMTALLLLVTGHFGHPPISEYYARESYNLAHGRNVVNVILVDFRALDTLGEATVLAVAAMGAYALVKLVAAKGGGE